jgi:hypothetical protein
MKKVQVLLFALTMAVASLAHAQATRTWVSGVGDDANPCSRTAPCKTFAGAISKTANGGIINAIDSGGFGAVTITKSITIDTTPFMGGVLASGTSGIVIAATATDKITLRGLDIEGVSGAIDGVRISGNAGVVTVENCEIFGYQRGIADLATSALKLNIINCNIRNNTIQGVQLLTSFNTNLMMDFCRVYSNTGNGLEVGANCNGTVSRSSFAHNTAGGVTADASTSFVSLEECNMFGNQFGVFSGTASASTIVLSRCIITKNTAQGVARAGFGALGTVTGFSNNVISGNAGNESVTSSLGQV